MATAKPYHIYPGAFGIQCSMLVLHSYISRLCLCRIPQPWLYPVQGALPDSRGWDHHPWCKELLLSILGLCNANPLLDPEIPRIPRVCQGPRWHWLPQRRGAELPEGAHCLEGSHPEDPGCYFFDREGSLVGNLIQDRFQGQRWEGQNRRRSQVA